MRRIEGKTALVTGSARGIGAAIAERLRSEGATVLGLDREGGENIVACDLADPHAVTAAVARIVAERGGCDILVNNAGAYPTTPLDTLSLDDWRQVFAVNVDAALLLSQALAPGMRARRWGRIVNIVSGTIGIVRRDIAAYVSSKMALVGLTRALASDLGPDGITVNAVAPGLTETEGVRDKFDRFDDLARSIGGRQAIPRLAGPGDIAGAVAFLASDDAAMVTGQTLMVDGGWVRL